MLRHRKHTSFIDMIHIMLLIPRCLARLWPSKSMASPFPWSFVAVCWHVIPTLVQLPVSKPVREICCAEVCGCCANLRRVGSSPAVDVVDVLAAQLGACLLAAMLRTR